MATVSLTRRVGKSILPLLPAVFALAIGCGGRGPEPAAEVDSRLGDTLLAVSSIGATRAPAAGPGGARVLTVTAADTLAPPPEALVAGWRIQVFAHPQLAEAERAREAAARATGLPAYVEYRAPLYRVRVGDFLDRGTAVEAQARVAGAGYENAGVVATLVRARPGR